MSITLIARRSRLSNAFTLVELLVVIAIIGVLVALLLPAVQAAREAARRAQCTNHLKQFGLAFLNHESQVGVLPSGGWGFKWVGDADSGLGDGQPGGWAYSILPFIERQNLFDLGSGGSPSDKLQGAITLMTTPRSEVQCPSRRAAELYPFNPGSIAWNKPRNPGLQSGNPPMPDEQIRDIVKSDYAANAGNLWQAYHGGPTHIDAYDSHTFPEEIDDTQGTIFFGRGLRIAEFVDGTSATIAVGEKYVSPDLYDSWTPAGDSLSMYIGLDPDVARWLGFDTLLQQDRVGLLHSFGFGSPHPGVVQFGMCDGSVQTVEIDADPLVLAQLANRADLGADLTPPQPPVR